MHEIEDLKALGNLAEWDQNTEMPEGAGEVRGYQMATLQGVLHECWTTQRLGSLLNELSDVINRSGSGYTDADEDWCGSHSVTMTVRRSCHANWSRRWPRSG